MKTTNPIPKEASYQRQLVWQLEASADFAIAPDILAHMAPEFLPLLCRVYRAGERAGARRKQR